MNIRLAKPGDSKSIAKIQVNSYCKTYYKIFPCEYLEHFTYDEQEQDWQTWFSLNKHPLYIAENAQNELIGYAMGQPNQEEFSSNDGELVALHVALEYQRQGLGKLLFATVCQELAKMGCQSIFLWVLADNPARGFYEKLGGKYIKEKAWINNDYFGTNIFELAYRWDNIKDCINIR